MTFDPPFPLFAIALLALAAAGVAVWRELSGRARKLRPSWFHPVCLILRLGAIAALFLLLLNPSRRRSAEPTASQSVILLDASASMGLAADEEDRSRWEMAREFANDTIDAMAEAELAPPRLTTFSAGLDLPEPREEPTGRPTNLAGGLERLIAGPREDVPDQVILLSDGRIHDRERLGAALGLAKAAGVPVSTRVFGIDRPPRNARLAAVQAPRMVRPRSPVAVHVDVAGTGIKPSESLNLTVRDDDGNRLGQQDFYLVEDLAEQRLVFDSGLRTGRYHLELNVPGEPEIDTIDNRFSFTVEIASSKLRVLYLEGSHTIRSVGKNGHAWNVMEYITRAWEKTGDIEYDCLTPTNQYAQEPNLVGVTFQNGEMLLDSTRDFPKSREGVNRYDVMLVSDVSVENFSDDQLQWVVDWVVDRGGGFLMGGGNTAFDKGGWDRTLWERLIPVDVAAYGAGTMGGKIMVEIPESVRDHPLWAISPDEEANAEILAAHPPFNGMNRVRRAKPGAVVLARRSGTDEPVIAAQRYGRGRAIAFLPDPNGAWGELYMTWGPDAGKEMGPRIELGHGHELQFNESAAAAAEGPAPEHPSPWYARYWVNLARWLGENSVRWQRDKLAGRIGSAQAHPGEKLPVAAEVLAVAELDELLALDVGARLDLPGSRRVRLLYDRDRREFTGNLAVPLEMEMKTEIDVLFDVAANGHDLSQAIPVGIHRGNPEFRETAPDPVFLADLARATGGSILESAADAARSSLDAAEKRARESRRSWSEPLWSEWWPWATVAVLFSLEWALRRRGRQRLDDDETVKSAAATNTGVSEPSGFVTGPAH